MLDSLLADCRPHAPALGCARRLDGVPRLAAAHGAACQRKFVALTPRLDELVASLANRSLAPDRRAKGARGSSTPISTDRKERHMCRWPADSGSPTHMKDVLYRGTNSLVDS